MVEKKKLTRKGYNELVERLNYLLDVAQPENLRILQEARAQGDLSENADYDAARDAQKEIEQEITDLRGVIGNCIVVDEQGNSEGKITFGATVEFVSLNDNTKYKFQIVGSQEANPFENKISEDCILSKCILGHKAGDKVEILVETPYTVEIKNVTFGK